MAGIATAVGVDGWRLLNTHDPVEAMALSALTRKAVEARHKLHEHQAAVIAQRIGELF